MGHLFAFGLGGGSSSDGPLLAPLDLYVASVGLDTNDGLTPATPVLTMAGAYSKITTRLLGAPVRIHVGTFAALVWAPIPDFVAYNDQGQVIINCDGAGQVGENGFQTLVSGTAGAATTNVSLDSTALALPPDAVQGASVEVAGQRRTILTNSATEIVPSAAFNPAPAPGAAFSVIVPATVVDLTTGDQHMLEGANSLYPTIINLGVFGGGSGNAMLVDTADCLKLYGCLFANSAYLTVRNSQVYTGMAVVAADNDRTGIHIPELWAALGGTQNWEGWGLAGAGDLAQANPIQSLTGYLVVTGQLWVAPDSKITWLAGYAGSILADYTILDFQFPTQLTGTLVRSAVASSAIAGSFLDIRVNNSLILQNPNQGSLLTLVNSSVNWIGDCTISAVDNSNGLIAMKGGTFTLDQNLTFNLPAGVSAACAIADDASIWDIGGQFNVNNDGDGFSALAAGRGAQVSIGSSFNITTSVLQTYVGLTVAQNAQVLVTGDVNMPSPLIGALSQESGHIHVGGTANITDAAQFAWAQSASCTGVASDMILSGSIGALIIDSQLLVSFSTQITTTGGAAYITDGSEVHFGQCTIVDTQDEMPAITVGNIALVAPVAGAAQLSLSGSVSGLGPAIQADSGSTVVYAGDGTLDSAFTALVVNGGADFIFSSDAATTINAPNGSSNGIDCTGGGRCFFQAGNAPPTFVVGGSELVVGFGGPGTALPTVLALAEQSTYAAALPTPGSSYANAGAGSSFTRNL